MLENWFLGFFEADGTLTHQRGSPGWRVPSAGITQSDPRIGRIASILIGGRSNYVVPKLKYKESGYGKYSGGKILPRWNWQARNKDDLLSALWFFDQHPLIGPKKKEYKIWRKMVLRYIERTGRDPVFLDLCDELSATRKSKQKNFRKE